MSPALVPPDGLRLREGQSVDGLDLTRADAAALNATALVTVTPTAAGWRVTAAQVVGSIHCAGLDIRVTPKVGPAKVLTLLARAHGIRGLSIDLTRLGLTADTDLTEVLAVLFEHEARDALAHGPLRGYRTEDQSLPVVRGRIRLIDQEVRRFGALIPIEVTVDEWTVDTDDNRRIRAATRRLLHLPQLPAAARVGLHQLDRALTGVTELPAGVRLGPWTPTRINARLQRLLALADLVLAGSNVEGEAGPVETYGFTLRMEWVFERLVERLFAETCADVGLRLAPQSTLDLDRDRLVQIRPDLIIERGREQIAVADTKYKLLDAGKLPNADVYQLVAYCRRLGLPVGHLVYAAHDEHHVAGELQILGADVQLRIHAVDLTVDLPTVEADLRRVAEACLDAGAMASVAAV